MDDQIACIPEANETILVIWSILAIVYYNIRSFFFVRLIEIMTNMSYITRKDIYDEHPLYFFKLSLGGGNLVGEVGSFRNPPFPISPAIL